MNYQMTDIGAKLLTVYQGIGTLTAGGTGDDTAITGASVLAQNYNSGKLVVIYTATLAEGKKLDIDVAFLHSDDNSTWTTVTVETAKVISTGGTGGSTNTGVYEYDFNREKIGRYIKCTVTPNLDATGTDTAKVATLFVLGGAISNAVSVG